MWCKLFLSLTLLLLIPTNCSAISNLAPLKVGFPSQDQKIYWVIDQNNIDREFSCTPKITYQKNSDEYLSSNEIATILFGVTDPNRGSPVEYTIVSPDTTKLEVADDRFIVYLANYDPTIPFDAKIHNPVVWLPFIDNNGVVRCWEFNVGNIMTRNKPKTNQDGTIIIQVVVYDNDDGTWSPGLEMIAFGTEVQW